MCEIVDLAHNLTGSLTGREWFAALLAELVLVEFVDESSKLRGCQLLYFFEFLWYWVTTMLCIKVEFFIYAQVSEMSCTSSSLKTFSLNKWAGVSLSLRRILNV